MSGQERTQVAVLGGGCFWCLEAVFERLRGVKGVESGYAGGAEPNPTYEQVCSGSTGHAEVVRIEYDGKEISFREILEVFFTIHDPTTPNRQGADMGTQYRSIILYGSPEQKETAEAVIAELERERVFDDPVVTEVVEAGEFHPAERFHQEYYDRNRSQPYCRAVIEPKLEKFRETFARKMKGAADRESR